MTMGSLFAGIGGFDLGFARAGFETVWQVEIDPWCRQVLKKHFPNAERFKDIRECGAHNLAPVDVICGGFPCQPFSSAGKQGGTEDDRYLWPEMLRVISDLRPSWVVGENVYGLVAGEMEPIFEQVLLDLEALGYEVQAFVIPACAVDAPHRRDRVWIVGHSPGERCTEAGTDSERSKKRATGSSTVANSSSGRRSEPGEREDQQPGRAKTISTGENVSHGNESRLEERERQPGQCRPIRVTAGQGLCGERPFKWEPESAVGRVANGVPRELDLFGGLDIAENYDKKKKPAFNLIRWEILRAMWEHRELAKTSPRLYLRRLYDCMPGVSYHDTQEGWYLGAWIEKDKEMRDMWESFYSKSFQEAQDLQQKMLEQIRGIERSKKVGPTKDRVNRLKGLGNAVVPQIPEIFARFILEIEQGQQALRKAA